MALAVVPLQRHAQELSKDQGTTQWVLSPAKWAPLLEAHVPIRRSLRLESVLEQNVTSNHAAVEYPAHQQ